MHTSKLNKFFSAFVISILLFSSFEPIIVLAQSGQIGMREDGEVSKSADAPSELLDVEAAKQPPARTQLDRPEARGKLDEVLPPGTQPGRTGNNYRVFIPVVVDGQPTPSHDTEIALNPDTWFSATASWNTYTNGAVRLRYPKDAVVRQMDQSRQAGLTLSKDQQEFTIRFVDGSVDQIPQELQDYQKQNVAQPVEVKGFPAWQAVPAEGIQPCKSVFVFVDERWIVFTLNSISATACLGEQGIFDLIVSSLQIGANENALQQADENAPKAPQAPNWINYNRDAAYNYQATWWDDQNNDDGYYISGNDGAHYLAHVLQAGGFPIHWSAGQNNNVNVVYNIGAQRNYVQNSVGNVFATNRDNLQVGDIVYFYNGSWCWGMAVNRMSGGNPYGTTHSQERWNIRYDGLFCVAGSQGYTSYEFNHIDANVDYPANPQLSAGLSLDPSAQRVGYGVTAGFTIHNFGGQPVNSLQMRVTTNGSSDFATTTCDLPSGGDCSYNQSQTFPTAGNYNTCAQINTGSGWINAPVYSGVACQTLSIVNPNTTDVKITTAMQVTPQQLPSTGGNAQVSFGVTNTGSYRTTERYRVRVTSGGVTFTETSDIGLDPGGTYTYSQSATFPTTGVYEVIAEHFVLGAWTTLLATTGRSNGFVRVMAPTPEIEDQKRGVPPGSAFVGEPVNTSTGNYYYDFVDMSVTLPGMPIAVARRYNALDAAEINGPFGYGSAWEYGMNVSWRSDKTATVLMGDGHLAYFLGEIDPANPTEMAGVYQGQDDDIATLARASDSSAVLTFPNQVAYSFNAAGKLTQISHPYPVTISLTYQNGALDQIVHSEGVTYSLSYTNGRISSITSSNSQTVSYTYSPAGDLATVTRADGSTYQYFYDSNHRQTEARDPNGHAFVRNVYDEHGRVVTQYDQSGQESTFTYEDVPATLRPSQPDLTDIRTYTDAAGNTTTHVYDTNVRLIQETDALGHTTEYTYNDRGNILTKKDPNGYTWAFTYDVEGNLLTETNPLGNAWTYQYDTNNDQVLKRDPLGHTWSYTYDANNRVSTATDPLGNTHEYIYDADGHLVWEQDELGGQYQYEYNARGQLTKTIDPLSHETTTAYDALGNRASFTDPNGHIAQFTYDELGRLQQSTDPAGTVTEFTYDPMGNLLTETDGLGHVRQNTYDVHDRLTSRTDFNGNVTEYGYDALGRQTVITDTLGGVSTLVYDAVGNLIEEKDKTGAVTRHAYDAAGHLTQSTDPLGRVTTYLYDAAGRQIETRRPCDSCPGSIAVDQIIYDAAGNVVKQIDPRGGVTEFTYDELGRKATQKDTYGHTRTFSYDALGQLIQETDELGNITQYTYDLAGNQLTKTNALGDTVTNVYDAVGNLLETRNERSFVTTFSYDENNRQTSITDALGNTTVQTYDDAGRLLTSTNALTQTTTYAYDANGNQISVTDPLGRLTQTDYDELNRAMRTTDALGHESTTTYDLMGRVLTQTNALGGIRRFTYDAAGRKLTESTPLGFVTQYTYDSADHILTKTEPTGAIWRFEYDANGNQTKKIDPLGNIWLTEYDLLNRGVREIDPLGAITQTLYDAAGNVSARTDARNAVTRYEYDDLNRQVRQIGPLGQVTTNTYDKAGNVTALQDARGFVTTYEFDALNRQITQTDPFGKTRQTVYDDAGRVVSETDYNGKTVVYAYDAVGNRTSITDPLGHTTTTAYDALNHPISVTDALGNVTTTAYDALGQAITQTTPLLHATVTTYDADGRAVEQEDALGHVWTTEYDRAGRAVRKVDPLGRAQVTSYNLIGQVASVQDALDRVTSYQYDQLGRLLVVTAPDGTAQRYSYDPVGNVLTEQDGRGVATTYQYDLAGRIIRKTNPLGSAWRYRYDAAGNLTDILLPSGKTVAQTYDALGRLTGKAYDGVQELALTYDANGNRLTMADRTGTTTYTYNERNQLVASTGPDGQVVEFGYDAYGHQTSIKYPDGAVGLYEYNAESRLNKITTPENDVTTYQYDALGRPTLITQGNGVTVTFAYDAAGNLLDQTQKTAANVTFARQVFQVDAANRRTQKTETTPNGVITTSYGYDALDRLVSSTASDGIRTTYTFDAAGNRLTQAGFRLRSGALENYTRSFVYNNANQLLGFTDSRAGQTVYTYDDDGNRATMQGPARRAVYTYNAESRMLETHQFDLVNASWTPRSGIFERYYYDGDGRRVRQEAINVFNLTLQLTRASLYDNSKQWNVLQTSQTGIEAASTQFMNAGALHKLAFWNEDGSGYFQSDALQSMLGATDETGSLMDSALARYDDYGEIITESETPAPDGFTGYEHDDYTGLDYARNRYYDSTTGVFLTVDPYPAERGDVLDLNRYLYVQANPINMFDPLGLFNWPAQTTTEGDTWVSIASAWGTTADELKSINPNAVELASYGLLQPGQHLNLPKCNSAKCQQIYTDMDATLYGTRPSWCGSKGGSGGGGWSGGGGSSSSGGYSDSTGNVNGIQTGNNSNTSRLNFNPNSSEVGVFEKAIEFLTGAHFEFNIVDFAKMVEKVSRSYKGRPKNLFQQDLTPGVLKAINAIGINRPFFLQLDSEYTTLFEPDLGASISVGDRGISGELCISCSSNLKIGINIPAGAFIVFELYGTIGYEFKGCLTYSPTKGFNYYLQAEAYGGFGGRVYARLDVGIAGARVGIRLEGHVGARFGYQNNSLPFFIRAELAPFYGYKYWGRDWDDTDIYKFTWEHQFSL